MQRITMSPEQQLIWQRIESFRLDDGEAVFSFPARLARDNGWSKGYAARVISEYRRFVFLAVAAGNPVSPSDQVDQVWHLHLLYTDSYWNRLCKTVLRRPLHHGPTKGGDAERKKFNDWYGRTLDIYRRFFGEDPPADIWPDSKIRFGQDIHYQRVNTKRFWMIPKVWARVPFLAALVLLSLLLLAGCSNANVGGDSGGSGLFGIVGLLAVLLFSRLIDMDVHV